MKKLWLAICILFSMNTVLAYEDCILITNGKLNDIKIENNQIIDVYPLITIMNDRNTLIVHPLKEGETTFSVLKNKKKICVFNVKVENVKTTINNVEGFEILQIDEPPKDYEFELDLPPGLSKK